MAGAYCMFNRQSLTSSIFLPHSAQAIIGCSVGPREINFSIQVTIFPATSYLPPVWPLVCPSSIPTVLFPLATVLLTVAPAIGSGSASIAIANIPFIYLSIQKLHNSIIPMRFFAFIQGPRIDYSDSRRLVSPGKVENMPYGLWRDFAFGMLTTKLVETLL